MLEFYPSHHYVTAALLSNKLT